MFIQFIEGPVSDPEALRRQLDRWQEQCAGGAVGWLGSTAGVTSEGTGFLSARFASAEDARANSERAEQSAWWTETEKCFDGTVSFVDCDDVLLFGSGGSDDAGFVQVMRGRVNDPAAAHALLGDDLPDDARPDVLGGLVGLQPDGAYTMIVYFTSEAEARAGEAQEDDDEFAEQMEALHDEPPAYLDLADPWCWSP
jgi:hypothetical protein